MQYDSKVSLSAVTADTVGADVDVSRADKSTINIVATGGSVGGTVKVWGKDGHGNTVLIDSEAWTAAGTDTILVEASYSYIYVEVASYSAGTFTASVGWGKSAEHQYS